MGKANQTVGLHVVLVPIGDKFRLLTTLTSTDHIQAAQSFVEDCNKFGISDYALIATEDVSISELNLPRSHVILLENGRAKSPQLEIIVQQLKQGKDVIFVEPNTRITENLLVRVSNIVEKFNTRFSSIFIGVHVTKEIPTTFAQFLEVPAYFINAKQASISVLETIINDEKGEMSICEDGALRNMCITNNRLFYLLPGENTLQPPSIPENPE